MTITMITMMVIIFKSLFHLKEKWVPHMDNNNIKKYMYKRLSFKSVQQHTGKVNTSSIIKQNIYYLWKWTVHQRVSLNMTDV